MGPKTAGGGSHVFTTGTGTAMSLKSAVAIAMTNPKTLANDPTHEAGRTQARASSTCGAVA
jgi:hypothetical protein